MADFFHRIRQERSFRRQLGVGFVVPSRGYAHSPPGMWLEPVVESLVQMAPSLAVRTSPRGWRRTERLLERAGECSLGVVADNFGNLCEGRAGVAELLSSDVRSRKFALDSALEGDGFELPVPDHKLLAPGT